MAMVKIPEAIRPPKLEARGSLGIGVEVLRVVRLREGEHFLLAHLPGGGLGGLTDLQVLEVAHRVSPQLTG